MTNKQYKVLRSIKKYRNYYSIMKHLGYLTDEYLEIQQIFECGSAPYMRFSDSNFDEKTEVFLTELSQSALDEHTRSLRMFWIPVIISIAALMVSIFK